MSIIEFVTTISVFLSNSQKSYFYYLSKQRSKCLVNLQQQKIPKICMFNVHKTRTFNELMVKLRNNKMTYTYSLINSSYCWQHSRKSNLGPLSPAWTAASPTQSWPSLALWEDPNLGQRVAWNISMQPRFPQAKHLQKLNKDPMYTYTHFHCSDEARRANHRKQWFYRKY